MKTLLDARPYKTFTLQISFGAGWRHEPPKFRGAIRKSLEETLGILRESLPVWFDVEYFLDSEYSSVIVRGPSEDQDELLRVLRILESDFPPFLDDLGAGFEIAVFSGGVRRSIVDEYEAFDTSHVSHRLKLHQPPRRFLGLKELSRVHKHFLVYLFSKVGGELFLEVSRRGDRLHYGRVLPLPKLDSLENEIKSYLTWLSLRVESTKESVRILTLMNIYSSKERTLESIVEEIGDLKLSNLAEAMKTLEKISASMSN